MKTIKRYYYEFLKERYVKCKNILGQDVYHVKEFEFSKDTYNGKIWMRYDNINDSDEKTLNVLNKKFERVWDDYQEAMYYLHKIHKIYSIPLCFHILYIALSLLFVLLAIIQGSSTGFSDVVPFCFLFGIALIILFSYFINFIVFVIKNKMTRNSIKLAKNNKDKYTKKIKLILEKSPLFNDRSLDFLDEEIAPLYKSETYDKYKKVSIYGSKIKKTIDVEDNEVNDLEEVGVINNPAENETVSSNQEDSHAETNAEEIIAVVENENSENNDNIALTDEKNNKGEVIEQTSSKDTNTEGSSTEEVLDTEDSFNNEDNKESNENNQDLETSTSNNINENAIDDNQNITDENQEVDSELTSVNEEENLNSEQDVINENQLVDDSSKNEALNSEDSIESNEDNQNLETNEVTSDNFDDNPVDDNQSTSENETSNQENNEDLNEALLDEQDNGNLDAHENENNQEIVNEEFNQKQSDDVENTNEI